ncbi:Mediator of RNA polymerase II transcription subunit 1 [Fragariocoptes setiger]|uniref:Mediator of RNA polymerase II transcription subunit 1 n=1 Tax=Fragariocoptes setiger TaxID=1670756 RepID=A0ABQ7S9N9_9ACAR|nr:Mediator of RNA polymerase II transcription subunit 1 [Fragariocoptes setiger]
MCQQILDFIVDYFRSIMYCGSVLLTFTGLIVAWFGQMNYTLFTTLSSADDAQQSRYLTIGGLYLVILSLVGCLGTYYNQKDTIRIFATLSTINQVVAVVIIFMMHNPVDKFESALNDTMKKYDWTLRYTPTDMLNASDSKQQAALNDAKGRVKRDGNNSIEITTFKIENSTATWDSLQKNYECCGLTSSSNWEKFRPKNSNQTFPKSCCDKSYDLDGLEVCKTPFDIGCLEILKKSAFRHTGALWIMAAINFLLAVVFCSASLRSDYTGHRPFLLTMTEVIDQFSYQQLKIDTSEDAEEICSALHPDVRVLRLEGNTFGVEASERIARSLAQLSKLEEAHFKDMFTARGKDEVPYSLTHLTNGIMSSGAKLRFLDMRDNAFGPIGMSGLIKYIQSDAALDLEEIYLTNCGLGPQGSTTLSTALGRLTKLRVLECGRNRLEAEGASAVCGALSELSQLETIIMYQNGIMSHGWKEVGEAIASNKDTLKNLDFYDNCIKVDGAEALAVGLSQTTCLETLNLSDCILHGDGFVAILKALSESASLHTLKELKFEGNEIDGPEAVQLICDLFENRRNDEDFVLNLLENDFNDEELEVLRTTLGNRVLLTMDEDDDDDDGDNNFELYEGHGEEYADESNCLEDSDQIETPPPSTENLKQFAELCTKFVNLTTTNQMSAAKSCLHQLCDLSRPDRIFIEAQILCTELGLMKHEITRKRKPVSEASLKFLAQSDNRSLIDPGYCRVLHAMLSECGDPKLRSLSVDHQLHEITMASGKVRTDSKKRAVRSTSNVFAMFTQNQIAEFKEAFSFIDSDKDGIINKNDLSVTWDALGRLVKDDDLKQMLSEAPGPINFTMFLSIFGDRIAGTDDESVIKNALRTFEEHKDSGKIPEEKLRKCLMTWGQKLTDDEIDTAFAEAPIDRQGNIDIEGLVRLITGRSQDENDVGRRTTDPADGPIDETTAYDKGQRVSDQTMVERLSSITLRVPGLKFIAEKSAATTMGGCSCFISSDMFYVEVLLDSSRQHVLDVKVSHQCDPVHCPVMTQVLKNNDLEMFVRHLDGLSSIYHFMSDSRQKSKAYQALNALETDLSRLANFQSSINDCYNLLHKSPVGVLEPRKGGLPVRLVYFLSPYDLIDTSKKGLINLTTNNIIDKNLGLSVSVGIESSSVHKLQTTTLISIRETQEGRSLPSFAPHTSQNSTSLPACFVLKLSQPMPLSLDLAKKIEQVSSTQDFLRGLTRRKGLLVNLIAAQQLRQSQQKQHEQSLPPYQDTSVPEEFPDYREAVFSAKLIDHNHYYHILGQRAETMEGAMVTKIPFTHPTAIPSILMSLRQQALFNFVLGSCIRGYKAVDYDASVCIGGVASCHTTSQHENQSSQAPDDKIFDVIPICLTTLCVSFQHPSEQCLAALEIDLKDINEVKCQIHALDKRIVCSDEYASKTMQKCWSIPVAMRAILKKSQERAQKLMEETNKKREKEMEALLLSSTQQDFRPGYSTSCDPILNQPLLNAYLDNSNDPHGHNFAASNSILDGNMSSAASDGTREGASSIPNSKSDPYNFSAQHQNENLNNQAQYLQRFVVQPNVRAEPQKPMLNSNGLRVDGSLLNKQNTITSPSKINKADARRRSQTSNSKQSNTMLMSMLSDIPSANSQPVLSRPNGTQNLGNQMIMSQNQPVPQYPIINNTSKVQTIAGEKQKRARKRKAGTDCVTGEVIPGAAPRSPKSKKLNDDVDAINSNSFLQKSGLPNIILPNNRSEYDNTQNSGITYLGAKSSAPGTQPGSSTTVSTSQGLVLSSYEFEPTVSAPAKKERKRRRADSSDGVRVSQQQQPAVSSLLQQSRIDAIGDIVSSSKGLSTDSSNFVSTAPPNVTITTTSTVGGINVVRPVTINMKVSATGQGQSAVTTNPNVSKVQASLKKSGPVSSTGGAATKVSLIRPNAPDQRNNSLIKKQQISLVANAQPAQAGQPSQNAKSRKGSIGAVLERLVGAVNQSPTNGDSQQASSESLSSDAQAKSDASQAGASSSKLPKYSRSTSSDSFALKQGSSGLKLTLTKTTKSSVPEALKTASPAKSIPNYTIPRLSKTQQQAAASQSTTTSSNDTPSASSTVSFNETPSSSTPITSTTVAGFSSTIVTPSSTSGPSAGTQAQTKRIPQMNFRSSAPPRSSVTSSTHPANRIPGTLGAVNRPVITPAARYPGFVVSTSNQFFMPVSQSIEASHVPQAIGPPLTDTHMNLMANNKPRPLVQSSFPARQSSEPTVQLATIPSQSIFPRVAPAPSLVNQDQASFYMPIQSSLQISSVSDVQPVSISTSTPIIASTPASPPAQTSVASYSATIPTTLTKTISEPVSSAAHMSGVSSSSDTDKLPTSTPSSPADCNQVPEVLPPPTLIPIESLDDEPRPKGSVASSDHPDDASDRLSIVDTNESLIESLSQAGTPKAPPSVNAELGASSPMCATKSQESGNKIETPANAIDSGPQEEASYASAPETSAANEVEKQTDSPKDNSTSTSQMTTGHLRGISAYNADSESTSSSVEGTPSNKSPSQEREGDDQNRAPIPASESS